MPKLSDTVKAFIVRELACYERPSEIAKAVRTEFGVEVTRQQVHDYNPEGNKGDRLAQKWRDIYEATRTAFLEDTSAIPVAHKAYRLNKLNRMIDRAESVGNLQLAAQLMEQAAKECGGHYGNTRKLEHTSPDGSMSPRPLSDFYPDPPAESGDGDG